MMFAAVTDTEATLIGVVSALIPAGIGFGAWLNQFLKGRREAKIADEKATREAGKEDRKDALLEWKDYVARQDGDIARLQKRSDDQDALIHELQASERECLRSQIESKEKIAIQAGVIERLTGDVRRLQTLSHSTAPGVTLPTIIIAGTDGIIADVTASCGSMFHWLPAELRGKNISLVIPERLRPNYLAGLKEVAEGRRQVDPAKPIMSTACRRSGEEFPVVINLSYWKSPRGSEFITAEIRDVTPDANT
jgi:PAS domain S-box-containing protein